MNAISLLCALALLPLAAAEPAASPPAAAQPTAALLSSAPNAKGARLCFIHDPGHYTDCPYRLCMARADGTLIKGHVAKHVAAIFHEKLPTSLQWMPGADDHALLHFREDGQSRVMMLVFWEEDAGIYGDEACAVGQPILEVRLPSIACVAPTKLGLACMDEGGTMLAHLYTDAPANEAAWEALCHEQPMTADNSSLYYPLSGTHAYSIEVQRRWSKLTLFRLQGGAESPERHLVPLLSVAVYGETRAERQKDALLLRAEDGSPLALIPLPASAKTGATPSEP